MNDDAENNESLKEALKAYGLREDISRIHKEMMPAMKSSRRSPAPVRTMFSIASRIAAAILFLIIGTAVYVYFTSTPSALFNSRYTPYQESAQRGKITEASAIKKEFLAGQSFLQSKQPLRSIELFNSIIEQNKRSSQKILNDDAEYYLGLSYLEAGKPEEALPLFEKIHNNSNHLYNDQVSSWFLMKVRIAAWKNR